MAKNIFDKFEGEFFENKNSDILVLVMHGSRGRFTHNLQHSLYLGLKEKFSIFNFNFPGEISKFTIDFELNCIYELIDYFSKEFSKIVLVGHSKSASDILCLQDKVFDKLYKCILIAPRIDLNNSQEMKIYSENGEKEFIYPSKNVKQLITKEYMDCVKKFRDIILNFNYPCKNFLIIYGLSDKVMETENYNEFVRDKNNFELKGFENSDHMFSNEKYRNKMINFILNWI